MRIWGGQALEEAVQGRKLLVDCGRSLRALLGSSLARIDGLKPYPLRMRATRRWRWAGIGQGRVLEDGGRVAARAAGY